MHPGKLRQRCNIAMLEDIEQCQEQEEEQTSGAYDDAPHGRVYYGGLAVAGRLVHHFVGRRQRCQSHGGKGIHDEVDP